MVHACVRGWRPGRGPTVVAGVLLLGSLCLAAPPKDLPPSKKGVTPAPEPFTHQIDPKTKNFNAVSELAKTINDKLKADWEKNKIVPSRHVDDHQFIRRASLDVIGRIARPAESKEFLHDPIDVRRSRLINRL